MEPKFCPLLKAVGFINGREDCSEDCAWYAENGGCALAILAESAAAQNSQFPVDLGKNKEDT